MTTWNLAANLEIAAVATVLGMDLLNQLLAADEDAARMVARDVLMAHGIGRHDAVRLVGAAALATFYVERNTLVQAVLK